MRDLLVPPLMWNPFAWCFVILIYCITNSPSYNSSVLQSYWLCAWSAEELWKGLYMIQINHTFTLTYCFDSYSVIQRFCWNFKNFIHNHTFLVVFITVEEENTPFSSESHKLQTTYVLFTESIIKLALIFSNFVWNQKVLNAVHTLTQQKALRNFFAWCMQQVAFKCQIVLAYLIVTCLSASLGKQQDMKFYAKLSREKELNGGEK